MERAVEKLQVYLKVRERRAEDTLNKIKQVMADDDLISPQDKIWEIVKIAAPGLRIEKEITRIFSDTADLLARHFLYRQNLLHQLWVNLIELSGVRGLLDEEKMDGAVYWQGTLSIMNDISDAAFLLRHNSYLGRPDNPVDPQEFLSYWVALAEALFEYYFNRKKPKDGWTNWRGLQSLMLKAAAEQPGLKAILEGKKKIPTIMDDGTLKDWIRIKAREHEKDRIRAHLEVDRILIDHLITLGYEMSGAAFCEHITPVDKLHSFKKSIKDLERGPE